MWYRLRQLRTSYIYCDVEADSLEEAIAKTRKSGDWEEESVDYDTHGWYIGDEDKEVLDDISYCDYDECVFPC